MKNLYYNEDILNLYEIKGVIKMSLKKFLMSVVSSTIIVSSISTSVSAT